jgi:hypothetical protein
MLSAEAWKKIRDEANAEIKAMTRDQRTHRTETSSLLADGGRISAHELARVNALCDLLVETMTFDEAEGKIRWHGETQSLVQFLLRARREHS